MQQYFISIEQHIIGFIQLFRIFEKCNLYILCFFLIFLARAITIL